MLKFIYILVLGVFVTGCVSAQETSYHIIKKDHIGGTGGWDYIFANPTNQRLYVSHGNRLTVLNLVTGDSVGVVSPRMGVHGVAIIEALGRGYTSNGRSNSVSVFDLKTNQILKDIPTGQNPDAIFYDDFNGMIITCNGRSNDLSFIDPKTDKVIATVAVGGKPETVVSDGKGHVFVNVEDKNEVVKINSKTHEVEAYWKLAKGKEPTGLALDRATHRLIVGGGGNKYMEILDTETGKSLFQLPIGEGCDGIVFDQTKKLAFASNGEGTVTIVKELSANDFRVVQTVKSAVRARTITVDPTTHHIFLPSAQFKPVEGQRWPMVLPGTFFVLELGE
ncbi:MAG: YncE family protein [Bacteroidetes bacterium]|nr:YncE family protein [Bacteroidota bacterium]MBU1373309.1 YncE family protein [Bacteroidota bacterium]MBU1484400.1 YncE family protein [Bacteroidota bacterium]MBU1761722.1 YncE family protein [Bacteroidota bacterium]MBU2047028.1 YncE family protein [Bacteroidota bacterium]